MKFAFFNIAVLVGLTGFFISCVSEKDNANREERVIEGIRTDGIYIAKNNNAKLYHSDNTSNTLEDPITIIRFLENKSGVIIPEGINPKDSLSAKKIKFFYDWVSEGFAVKNPDLKEYTRFSYKIYSGDSIAFQQNNSEMKTFFYGNFFNDSLKIKYRSTTVFSDTTSNVKYWKNLNFKFYPL